MFPDGFFHVDYFHSDYWHKPVPIEEVFGPCAFGRLRLVEQIRGEKLRVVNQVRGEKLRIDCNVLP